ncbi:MAG: hypothetical protein ACOYW3_17190, partial [Bacteroidota bacterium]
IAVIIFSLQYFIVLLFPKAVGYPGWLLFAFIIGRFLGVPHPPTEIEEPLSLTRKVLGWLALIIFLLCFTPNPIELIIPEPPAEGLTV